MRLLHTELPEVSNQSLNHLRPRPCLTPLLFEWTSDVKVIILPTDWLTFDRASRPLELVTAKVTKVCVASEVAAKLMSVSG